MIKEAYTCDHETKDCVEDRTAVTINLGYLREILDTLDACRKQRI